MTVPILEAIARTKNAFDEYPHAHWIVGFSGGKDSTALLKILYAAALKANRCPERIDVIYCDTGVENPVLDIYVKKLLFDLGAEFKKDKVPFDVKILSAPVSERFFVKIIGRGYPPPTIHSVGAQKAFVSSRYRALLRRRHMRPQLLPWACGGLKVASAIGRSSKMVVITGKCRMKPVGATSYFSPF